MRSLDELINLDDSAWPMILAEVTGSPMTIDLLPADNERGRACLLHLQVTTRSYLGAIALHAGGLLIDHGWLRVFGGAAVPGSGLPGLAEVNAFPGSAPALIVADDVLGGVFAINGPDPAAAHRPGNPGGMTYFAPDTMAWEPLDVGHGAWLSWLLSGGTDQFYADLRWPDWQTETARLRPSEGLSVFPHLWSKEAREDLAATSRRPVPMKELLGLHTEFHAHPGNPTPGFLGLR
ncbi:DUF2625 family protein [Embleya sp. NBC_00896]|uniref:DUF2625 family protein n=1 Tax=Embleya sp. NBC_00896 TaxID=2975961 RepID=UPI003863C47A|nr:DUF2625 domain-containing protein [Embleya sp. NBC_00896]